MSFILNPYRYAGFVNANSLSFDGTNEYVTMGNVLDYNYNDAFSLSGWFYFDTVSTNLTLISKEENSGNFRGYQLRLQNTGKLRFNVTNKATLQAQVETSNTYSANTWYHIVATKSTSSDVSGIKIYVNGSSQTLTTLFNTLSTNTSSNTIDFQIGARDGNVPFDGYIVEVSVWNKELTSGEVSSIYNSGCPNDLNSHSAYANLISWWRMGDGDTISSITDQIDKKYLSFDGTNEYVSITNNSSISFDRNDSFSLSLWFNADTITLSDKLLSKRSGIEGYEIYFSSTNELQFILNGLTSGRRIIAKTTTAISTSTWYHLTITYDGSRDISGLNIYINGVVDTVINIDNDLLDESCENSDNFLIGAKSGGANYFDGYIDEVSVWNKELSATEVTALYDEGRYNPKYEDLSFYSDAVSYWRMGEDDTISSITDLVGSNDGTPTNMDSSNLIDGNNDGTPTNMDSSNITTTTPC